jgi:hypothetical protein
VSVQTTIERQRMDTARHAVPKEIEEEQTEKTEKENLCRKCATSVDGAANIDCVGFDAVFNRRSQLVISNSQPFIRRGFSFRDPVAAA